MFETNLMRTATEQGSPPIPPMPSRPGASTGGQATGTAVTGDPVVGQQGAEQASEAARIASEASRTTAAQIQEAIQQGMREGQTVVTVPPPYRSNSNEIPPEVIPIVGMVMGTAIAIAVLTPIARAFARFINRRADMLTSPAPDVTPQLRVLQESIDVMALELERISEAQRFQAKLMAERPASLPAERGSGAH